ncbi:hypothetical protein ALC60_07639 [Trachymyrmex zeteki]|uniref:DUF1907 domain-containing protein n=1 Tax=Mycetomoellerius zeteki TaxID=64791 RepID=A0A151WZT1_9HYME|nr:hypothetical protein ALC60_07639 [Trachymyrmex zeteki]
MNAMYRASNDIRNESRIIFANRALGGVLRIRNGRVACNVMCDEYQEPMPLFYDFIEGQQCPEIDLKSDMIAVGAIINDKPELLPREQRYGLLIMNATYRAPNDIRNESRIIFANRGGVLRMRNGRVACNVMWDEYEEPMPPFYDFVKQLQCPEIDLESDMVAVGTILNDKPELLPQEQRYGLNLYKRSEFHCFSNSEAGGQFISDTTPDTTEYEGYFNIAKKLNLIL